MTVRRAAADIAITVRVTFTGYAKKLCFTACKFVSLEILIRSASILAQIEAISFLTLNRNHVSESEQAVRRRKYTLIPRKQVFS